MKKTISSIVGFAILFGFVLAPALAGATSTSTAADLIATLNQQIAALQAQIAALNAQLQAIKQTQQEIKATLQLTKQLRLGMRGDDVEELQEFLATDHDIYPEGLITGYFGKATEKAVKRLQAKLCIGQVGQVGPTTLWRINELLTEGAGKSGKIPPGLLRAPGIQKKLCPGATTTVDTTVPVITNVMATGTTAVSTKITWTTDESANGTVWYSTVTPVNTATSSTLKVSSADYLLAHEINLTGLTANTTYYFVVTSADKAGNVATSSQYSFTTLATDTTAPVITNVMATGTTATASHITWMTNELANSKVWYSTVTPVNTAATSTPQQSSALFALSHDILLSGLTATTTYYYVVSSADSSNNTTNSTEYSFTTLGQ